MLADAYTTVSINVIVHVADTAFCEVDVRIYADSNFNLSSTPDDTYYPRQWDMAHINVPKVWAAGYMGSRAVQVCVLDTGIDYNHPDIAANMWTNPVEAAGAGATAADGYRNAVDDDNNGILV